MKSSFRFTCSPSRLFTVFALFAALWLPARAAAPEPFELKDGDRVLFIGDTFFEREVDYGHIETRLTAAFPDRNITFRNLGWSGDTVWGEARARFGTAADGFQHLKEHVLALKQAADARLAGGKAAEHEGAVRDRLVARHPGRAAKGRRFACRGWLGGG